MNRWPLDQRVESHRHRVNLWLLLGWFAEAQGHLHVVLMICENVSQGRHLKATCFASADMHISYVLERSAELDLALRSQSARKT